jgi:hypothetical protein
MTLPKRKIEAELYPNYRGKGDGFYKGIIRFPVKKPDILAGGLKNAQ